MISWTVSKWTLEAFFSSTGKSECLYPSCFLFLIFLLSSWDHRGGLVTSPHSQSCSPHSGLLSPTGLSTFTYNEREGEKKSFGIWVCCEGWLFLFYYHNKTQLKFSFCFSPHSKIPWIVYYYWQLSTSIKEDELWMKTMHFLGVLWLSWAKLRCRVQWGIGRNLKGCFRWTNVWKLGDVV